MKNSRKTQLDKFNQKWSKDHQDMEAIKRGQVKSAQEEIMKGERELSKQGGIKEAAAVFSREGMDTFAKTFSNSVESAITSQIPNIEKVIERVIEKKIMELLDGLKEGLTDQEVIQNHIEKSIMNLANFNQTEQEKPETYPEEPPKKQPYKKPKAKSNPEKIVEAVQDLGNGCTGQQIKDYILQAYGEKWEGNKLYYTANYAFKRGILAKAGRGKYKLPEGEHSEE